VIHLPTLEQSTPLLLATAPTAPRYLFVSVYLADQIKKYRIPDEKK